MKDLVKICKQEFEGKFNTFVEFIDSPVNKTVIIEPFDGDKRLHGRISVHVTKQYYDEIPAGKIRVMLSVGLDDIDVVYVNTINELRDVLMDYADVIEDVAA